MAYSIRSIGAGCFVLALAWGQANAKIHYISDQFETTLREGPGGHYGIVSMLKSGTRVDALSQDKKNGYSKIRLGSGETGWVMARYLTDQPAARERLTQALAALEKAKQSEQGITQELASMASQQQELTAKKLRLEEENASLIKELVHVREVSSNALALDRERNALAERVAGAKQQLEAAQQRIMEMEKHEQWNWFIAGAAVFGSGIFVGVVLPRLRLRRRGGEFEIKVP
ncbi:MAG: TIGR04211 family SH3 domain-containing protein [Gammaproteobacteria bacterium]